MNRCLISQRIQEQQRRRCAIAEAAERLEREFERQDTRGIRDWNELVEAVVHDGSELLRLWPLER